jgi:hypothetical protein
VLWLLLAALVATVPAYLTWRYGSDQGRAWAAARKLDRGQRPFAPDDDEEFLRELDRRRLHGDD